ncbi:uncharacterized protein LOC131652244 isoform X1 [Vicia villosa]|uniref:uncharacterized protein LOC131652244 isoform X1 n=1 Tax=Vicia villosa TaxID=3911 RepID=UPI00273B3AC5|nr:uncharacterized protein LOC131652244 isoform X1 [Vicia villosa]
MVVSLPPLTTNSHSSYFTYFLNFFSFILFTSLPITVSIPYAKMVVHSLTNCSSSSSFSLFFFLPPLLISLFDVVFSRSMELKFERGVVFVGIEIVEQQLMMIIVERFMSALKNQNLRGESVLGSIKIVVGTPKMASRTAEEILSALCFIEKAKVDLSGFLDTLGGKESLGEPEC